MPSVVEFDCPYYSQQEKKVLFVTNNATKSRKNYKRKFDQLGVEAHVVKIYDMVTVEPQSNTSFEYKDEIYGSAYAAAVYISSVVKLPKDKKVYVIGMAGMEEELRDEGVSFIGGMVGTIHGWLRLIRLQFPRILRTALSNPSRCPILSLIPTSPQ